MIIRNCIKDIWVVAMSVRHTSAIIQEDEAMDKEPTLLKNNIYPLAIIVSTVNC